MIQRLLFSIAAVAGCTEVASPPATTMFVADRSADRIDRYDGVTGAWLGELAAVDRPSSVRFGPDHMLYIAGFGRSEILRIDPQSGATTSTFYKDTGALEEPVELLFRGLELVVLGHDTHNAILIDPSGTMVQDVGYPDMRGAHDFVFAGDGLLYVATEHDVSLGTAIQVWDVTRGTMVGAFGTLDQIANATGIVALGGRLYVTDYERGQLVHFDPGSGRSTILAEGLVHPISIDLGPDDLFYIADERGIHRFDHTGEYVSLFVPVGDQLVGPRGLTFVPDELLAK